jgi:alcohol dehydrogenase (cytochrome c)
MVKFTFHAKGGLVALALLLAACGQDGAVTADQAASNPATPAARQLPSSLFDGPPLTQPPVEAWLTNGGSWFNQRWSPLDEINRDNVAGLKGLWRVHLNGSGLGTQYSLEATPLYKDGKLYVSTGASDVFRVDVNSGIIDWEYQARFPEEMGGQVCCGWDSRGVALGEGKVFNGQLDGKLVALDENSGEVVWEVQAQRWEDGYSITGAPLYYDGMVITGYSGAEKGVRGLVEAFSAATGEKLWTFHTIPGPGEFGHDTWPQDSNVWEFGGGTVWQTPALDPELGLLYFSTGNPGPDYSGAIRPGDNLFTASIVAIDARTGEYRWHFQQVHHDIWDYDAPNPVILFDAPYAGVERKGLAQAGKTGWIYILDRITGEPLVGIEERPVPQLAEQATAPTQPYPIGDSFVPQFVDIPPEGAVMRNQGRIFTPFGKDSPTLLTPGVAGGANWAPSAYDPARAVMYVCASDGAMTLVMGDAEIPEAHGTASWTGGGFGGVSAPRLGIIAAVDITTNKLLWQYRWQDSCYSGLLATAGDLLFVGRNDGRLTALDIDTGMQLWEFQTGAGLNAPAISFEHEGRQYVAALSGGNLFARGSAKGDSLWLFALSGQMSETTPGDTPLMLTGTAAPQAVVSIMAGGEPDYANGESLYKVSCQVCHGEDGLGGHNNGMPLNNLESLSAAFAVLTTGRNNMPNFTGALSPEQLRDVTAFVVDRLFQ